MLELENITVKCTDCNNIDSGMCPYDRCVKCIVYKRPDPFCEGVAGCRGAQAKRVNECSAFKAKPWDN